ncbi:MAG: GtrA family protein [Glaciimonas sp.]|nr:GtrA family protein [Glaciimonas sp.]
MNTIVGYAIYALLVFAKIPYFAALLMATVAGVTFNYFSIGKLVFKTGGGLVIYYKFIAVYVIIYFVNVIGLELAIKFFKTDPYFGQALCVPPSVVLSWLLMSYWVFKK